MKHRIVKLACLVLLLPLSATSWALEQLDDVSLAAQTGQDGIDIGVNFLNSTINYDQIGLIDRDGMPGATGTASLVVAPWGYLSTDGIRMLNSSNAAVTTPIKIRLDADANNGTAPLLNIAVSLPTDLAKITMTGFSIYLAPDGNNVFASKRIFNAASPAKRAVVREVLAVDPTQIQFAANGAPKMLIQLGNAPQGHMLVFTGGAVQQITTPRVDVLSLNGSTRVNLTVSDLTFAANGYPANPNAVFSLAGFYADIADDGVVFGKAGATDKFDLTVSGIKAGTASASGNFNGLANGSVGGFGLIGAKVTDLQVNVKGL